MVVTPVAYTVPSSSISYVCDDGGLDTVQLNATLLFKGCVETKVSISGLLAGAAVDAAVGVAVGVAVGSAVGVAVGVAVGDAVGDAVGSAVGVAVGDVVGAAVGDAVGVAVGATVGFVIDFGSISLPFSLIKISYLSTRVFEIFRV